MNGRVKMLLAQEATKRNRENEYDNDNMRDRPYYRYNEKPMKVYIDPNRYEGNEMNYGENAYGRERKIGFDGGYSPEMHGGSSRNESNSRNLYFSGSAHNSERTGVTKEKAREWVEKMKNSDGSEGAHWNMEQLKNLREKMGFNQIDPMEFYVAVNMMYSDYCAVAKKYNIDNPEYYAHMAKAFLEDKDAGAGKLERYFEIVVDDD